MRLRPVLATTLLLACAPSQHASQLPAPDPVAVQRPIPYPVFETQRFAHAVTVGTRTRTGEVGRNYWQQSAHYTLAAALDPATAQITGQGSVHYENHSPDTLRKIAVFLYQNIYAPGATRVRPVPLTGGIALSRVTADGEALHQRTDDSVGYRVNSTVAWLHLRTPIPPGASATLGFDWSFQLPPRGAYRIGQDGEVFFVGYWYPQVAVYDDVSGWQTDPYLGNGEFYMDYADYDVALTVPAGWLVGATGTLQNADSVLTPAVRDRLAHAAVADTTVHIVTAAARGAGTATTAGVDGHLTWRFHANTVRDFAWATSAKYVWDATRARPTPVTSTLVSTLYRPQAAAWGQSARYAQSIIAFHSRALWPYPYPRFTAIEGVVGGMEFPMVVHIDAPTDTIALYSVFAHEMGHQWFPMQVGSDEKRYSWADEGLTTFNAARAVRAFAPTVNEDSLNREGYLELARTNHDQEVELMRHGDRFPVGSPVFGIETYRKTATVLVALNALLGPAVFDSAYRTYGRRWTNKHPQPYDLFNTFNSVSGRDLSWFWRTWFYETWTLDQAIASVVPGGDSTTITIEDRGLVPMPVRLAITRATGAVERRELPVDVWLRGATRATLRVSSTPAIAKVEIDPEQSFPDVDRSNNVWHAP